MTQPLQKTPVELEVFDLAEDVENKFAHLLSSRALASIERVGGHGVGVAVRDGEDLIPAGAMVFLTDSVEGDEGIESILEIIWMSVDEEYRNMGVGSRMMEIFAEVINNSDVTGAICDVPISSECDELVRFLGDWDFSFNIIDKNEYLLTWEDISYHPILGKKGKAPHVSALGTIPQDMLATCFRTLQLKEWSSLTIDDLDPKLSGIYFEGNTPEGVFLIRRSPENFVEPLLFTIREDSKDSAKVMKELLFHSINAFAKLPENIKDETDIYILIRTLRGAELWDKLFSHIEPAIIRRGVNFLKEE